MCRYVSLLWKAWKKKWRKKNCKSKEGAENTWLAAMVKAVKCCADRTYVNPICTSTWARLLPGAVSRHWQWHGSCLERGPSLLHICSVCWNSSLLRWMYWLWRCSCGWTRASWPFACCMKNWKGQWLLLHGGLCTLCEKCEKCKWLPVAASGCQ